MNSAERVAERTSGETGRLATSCVAVLELPAGTAEVVLVRALLLEKRLDTRALERDEPLGVAPLTVDIPDGGVAGVVSLWRGRPFRNGDRRNG